MPAGKALPNPFLVQGAVSTPVSRNPESAAPGPLPPRLFEPGAPGCDGSTAVEASGSGWFNERTGITGWATGRNEFVAKRDGGLTGADSELGATGSIGSN